MDFQKSEDTDRQRETKRLKWKWRRREESRGEGEKKLNTCMCWVSRPSYIKQTQINGGAIAFSERTADRPINEGKRSEDCWGDTRHRAVLCYAFPAVGRIQHLLLCSSRPFTAKGSVNKLHSLRASLVQVCPPSKRNATAQEAKTTYKLTL